MRGIRARAEWRDIWGRRDPLRETWLDSKVESRLWAESVELGEVFRGKPVGVEPREVCFEEKGVAVARLESSSLSSCDSEDVSPAKPASRPLD